MGRAIFVPMTPDEFRKAGHALVEWIAAYRERLALGEFPVQSVSRPGELLARLPAQAPEEGEQFDRILKDLDSLILPGITHWQDPRFFGYFPAAASLTSVLGDMVSSGLGVIGLNWQASPALTELEQAVTDWIRELLGLSADFSGVITDTASAATFVALVCARERASDYAAAGSGLQGYGPRLAIYASTQAHSSVEKAALLAGFGRTQIRSIPLDREFRMDVTALMKAVAQDRSHGIVPCAVVATSGTTATTAFDDVGAIAELTRRENIWLHVDGAMGGVAMLLPEYRHQWAGIEGADSIVVNAHKWMSVAFDCSIYFVRDPQHLTRVMSTNPSYLQTPMDAQVRNYRDWGIALGRRFRALKAWFALREEGAAAIRTRLRRDIGNAHWLAGEVAREPNWRVVAPVTLQTVCIRHEPSGLDREQLDQHNRTWCQAVNDSGGAYLTPAIVAAQWVVRVSIGIALTERNHVRGLWDLIRQIATGHGNAEAGNGSKASSVGNDPAPESNA
jgi:aromatic-L-amino-acid decarboxylase